MDIIYWILGILGFVIFMGSSMYDKDAGGFRESYGTAIGFVVFCFVIGALIVLFRQ